MEMDSIDDLFVAVVTVNADLRVAGTLADLMRMRRQTRPTINQRAVMRAPECASNRLSAPAHRRMLRR